MGFWLLECCWNVYAEGKRLDSNETNCEIPLSDGCIVRFSWNADIVLVQRNASKYLYYLHKFISFQPSCSTRSSSVVTIALKSSFYPRGANATHMNCTVYGIMLWPSISLSDTRPYCITRSSEIAEGLRELTLQLNNYVSGWLLIYYLVTRLRMKSLGPIYKIKY